MKDCFGTKRKPMPIIQFKCPSCKQSLRAYVDDSTKITCKCGVTIKPKVNGKAEIYIAPKQVIPTSKFEPYVVDVKKSNVEPNQTSSSAQPHYNNQNIPKQKDHSTLAMTVILIFFAVLVVCGIGAANEWYQKRKKENVSATLTPSNNADAIKHQKVYEPQNYEPQSLSQPQQQVAEDVSQPIVYVHIINTVMNSNKMIKSIGVLDETTKTMTLTSVENPTAIIKMITGNAGIVDVQFVNNDIVEANKQFYRRSDLETGDGSLIYTSRTGEITITLSY